MARFRRLLFRHSHIALAVLALAFLVRAAVPSGFMVAPAGEKILTVTICHGSSADLKTAQIAIPTKPGAARDNPAPEKQSADCAFSGLSLSALGGTPPALLAIALVALLSLGLAPVDRIGPFHPRYLRPPLRGPPPTI